MLADLLSECFATDYEETWERERTANTLTGVAVRSRCQHSSVAVSKLSLSRSESSIGN